MTTRPSDLAVGWYKSSYSNHEVACVEVRHLAQGMAVRDTKDRGTGPTLEFSAEAWSAFVASARDGEFDSKVQ